MNFSQNVSTLDIMWKIGVHTALNVGLERPVETATLAIASDVVRDLGA